jgi:hypothetical protein
MGYVYPSDRYFPPGSSSGDQRVSTNSAPRQNGGGRSRPGASLREACVEQTVPHEEVDLRFSFNLIAARAAIEQAPDGDDGPGSTSTVTANTTTATDGNSRADQCQGHRRRGIGILRMPQNRAGPPPNATLMRS